MMKKNILFTIAILLFNGILFSQPIEELDNWVSQQTNEIYASNVVDFMNGGRANDDISYGSEYIFNTATTYPYSAITLDATHFVVVYQDQGNSNYGTAVVGTVSGNTISYGSEYVFYSISSANYSATTLDATHFIVTFGVGSTGIAMVGTVSGNTISFGSEYIYNSAISQEVSTTTLDATHFVVTYKDYGNSNYGTAIVGTVSGNTVSYGSEFVFNTALVDDISVTAIDATHFVVAYEDGGNFYGTAVIGTVAGNVISYGSKSVYNPGYTSYISASPLDANHFVVTYNDGSNSSYGTARIGTVSGNTISYGSEYIFNSASSRDISSTTMDESHFVISYRDGGSSNYGTATIGTVSGNTISYGLEYVFNSAYSQNISATTMDATHFVVAYTDVGTSLYGTAIIGETTEAYSQNIITDETLCPTTENLTHTARTTSVTYGNFVDENANWVECNSIVSSLNGTNRSIFGWIKKTIAADELQVLVGINTSGSSNICNFLIGTSGLLGAHDGSSFKWTTSNVVDGSWHYVGYTFNHASGETKIYVDGGLEITYSSTLQRIDASGDRISLGQEFDGSTKGNFFEGFFTEVSFWNEVLDASDITIAMDSSIVTTHPKYANLKAYYPMIANSTDGLYIVKDFSGNGNNGNASHSDMQSANLDQITDYNAATNYTKNWLVNASSVGISNTIDLSSYDGGNYSLVLLTDFLEITDDWVVTIDANCTEITWDGSSGTNWDTEANWSGDAVPTATNNVTIADVTNKPVIAATLSGSCNDLTIANGATLTLQSTSSGTGSLITNGTVTNNGTFTVERFLSDNSWHLVTPSTTNVTANDFYWNETPMCWLTSHSEATNDWTYNTDLNTSMPVGQGWSVWIDDATKSNVTATMTGDIQTTDLSVSLTTNGDGWNLIGNPFTSAIECDNIFWNHSTGTEYVWDNDYNVIGGYRTWNGTDGDLVDGIIPISQAFFVQAQFAGSFTINTSARVHDLTGFYKSGDSTIKSTYIRLQLDSENHGNTVFIGFPEHGTPYFDNQGDATKLYSNDEFPQLYTVEDGIKLSTNALAPLNVESKTVPLHLDLAVDGEYTLTISQLENLPDVLISIEDTKTGVIHDFMKNPVYTFNALEGDSPDRFMLHFNPNAFGINDNTIINNDLIDVYAANSNIYVKSKNEAVNQKGTVEIYLVSGNLIKSVNIESGSLIGIPLYQKSKILIIKVIKPSAITIKKVFTN